jgi:hypothetical protein
MLLCPEWHAVIKKEMKSQESIIVNKNKYQFLHFDYLLFILTK